MYEGTASVAGAGNACAAWCVSVACDPSFGTWGIDEELRESRLLPGSTDGEGHTVRHPCTLVKSWHRRRPVGPPGRCARRIPVTSRDQPPAHPPRHSHSAARGSRGTHTVLPAPLRALQKKAVHVRANRLTSRSSENVTQRPIRIAPRAVYLVKGLFRPQRRNRCALPYAEHAGPLFPYVLRATSGDRQWAEDVVQQTPPRAWQHPAAFDPARGPARARPCALARHPVIDAHRARRARPAEADRDVPEQAAETAPG
ncbi:hypothetical protein OG937_01290 [Streptomyces sp. NBC_00510]